MDAPARFLGLGTSSKTRFVAQCASQHQSARLTPHRVDEAKNNLNAAANRTAAASAAETR